MDKRNMIPTLEVRMDLKGWVKSIKIDEESSNEIRNAMLAESNGEIKRYKTRMFPTLNLKGYEPKNMALNKNILLILICNSRSKTILIRSIYH